MRFFILLFVFLFHCPFVTHAQTTWFVPDDFATIQGAISDASVVNGDTVIVRPGTYTENINTLGKAIKLVGEGGAKATTIDGKKVKSVIKCINDEDESTVIQGFTITNGYGHDLGHGALGGAGMYNYQSSPTLVDCAITDNHTERGAGMYNYNSSPTLLRCAFIENSAYTAGAVYNWESSNPVFIHCSFIHNTANLSFGAMFNHLYCKPEIHGCTFIENSAVSYTGAVHNTFYSAPKITNCVFNGNTATSGGAVTDEVGAGVATIYANCIFWNNTPEQISTNNAEPIVTHCCVQGGWPGVGNIDLDPLFADPLAGDFHITYPSPCRNAGHNAAALTTEDFEGDPRIAYGTVDMGADEFYPHLYYTGAASPSSTIQVNCIGIPGTLVNGIILGVNIFDPPLPCDYGFWYIDNPMQIITGLGSIPADGVAVFPGTIPTSPPAPYTVYLQAAIDSWLTNLCVVEVE